MTITIRVWATLCVAALTLALLATVPAGAQSTAGAEVIRLSGADRFDTAAQASADAFGDPAAVDVVYIAAGGDFPDALAASAAAAQRRAPVLLVADFDMTAPTRAELQRLDPSEVVIAGGTLAVPQPVMDQIADLLPGAEVRRVSGANRFDTAAQLALDAWPDGAPIAYIATGLAFPDALAGVPAAAIEGAPLLLTATDAVPAETEAAMEELGVEETRVLGGTNAISSTSPFPSATRLDGPGRYETAVAVTRFAATSAPTVFVATGENFPDALAGGAAAAEGGGVLALTPSDLTLGVTLAELRALNPARIVILGGLNAIGGEVGATLAAEAADLRGLHPSAPMDLAALGVPEAGEGRQAALDMRQGIIGIDLDGRSRILAHPQRDQPDFAPVLSPDGTMVAWPRGTDDGAQLWAADVTTPRSAREIGDASVTGACASSISQLHWSADSRAVVGVCAGRQVDGEDASARAIVAFVDGSAPVVAEIANTDRSHSAVALHDDALYIGYWDGTPGPSDTRIQIRRIPFDQADQGQSGATVFEEGGQGGAIASSVPLDLFTSADGSQLGFVETAFSLQGARTYAALWTVAADDPASADELTHPDRGIDDLDRTGRHVLHGLTTDGGQLLVTSRLAGGGGDREATLRLIASDGSAVTDIVPVGGLTGEREQILRASLSPDDALVAWDESEDTTTLIFNVSFDDAVIRVAQPDGSEARTIPVAGFEGAALPHWNPAR